MKKLFVIALIIAALASSAFAGDVIVVLKETNGESIRAAGGVKSLSTVKEFTKSTKLNISRTYDALSEKSGKIFMLVHSDSEDEKILLENLRARTDVLAAAPNRKVYALETKRPNDAEYYNLWGMEAINAPEVWSESTGSEEIYVAVMDTGVDYTHPDLIANFSHEYSRNFVGSGTPDYDPSAYNDLHHHGTHCAGTVAAVGNNTIGVSGVNWKTKIISLRVLNEKGSGDTSDIVSALNYLVEILTNNPNLNIAAVNISIGGYHPENPEDRVESNDPYWLAYKTLSDLNRTVICVAAGNEANEVGAPTTTDNTEDHYNKGYYCYPASYIGIDNMIVVGAADEGLVGSSFTNYSKNHVDVAAPGRNILSTIPTTMSDDRTYDVFKNVYPYARSSGTSMATPHVAGVATLIKSVYPNATAREIKNAILGGANMKYLRDVSQRGFLDVKGAFDFMAASLSESAPKFSEVLPHEGTENQPYKLNFLAAGAENFTLEGELPQGLSFDNGIISGTPEESGEFDFIVTAENDFGSDSLALTLKIDGGEAPQITTEKLDDAKTGEYDFLLDASGSWPQIWTISDGMPPRGMYIEPITGRLWGDNISETGTFEFEVTVLNTAGRDSKTFTLKVEQADREAPSIKTERLIDGVLGRVYGAATVVDVMNILQGKDNSFFVKASGDAKITFDVSQGSLPIGLELDSDSGLISGTPTEAGEFPLTITAKNSYGTDSKDYTLNIINEAPNFFTDTITSHSFNKGFYSSQSVYVSGSGPMTFTVLDELPRGIEIIPGSGTFRIFGRPEETGDLSFSLRAENSVGSADVRIILNVTEKPVIGSFYIADAVKDKPYSFTLTTLNNVAATWEISGDLPRNLTLDGETGEISGTPTEAGSFEFSAFVKVSEEDGGTERKFLLTVLEAPEIISSELSGGKINTPYFAEINATGSEIITWSISNGELPAGMSLTSNGFLFGTPTEAGDFSFEVTASNNAGQDKKTFSLNIAENNNSGENNNDPDPENPGGNDTPDPTEQPQIFFGEPRGVSSLTAEQRALVENDTSMIAAIIPEFTVNISGQYSFDVNISSDVPEGLVMVWHSFSSSLVISDNFFENSAEDDAVFFDADGKEIIYEVPEKHRVKVLVSLLAGRKYAPVIAVLKERSAVVGSNGGGCDAFGMGILIGAAIIFVKLDRKRKAL